MPSQEPTQEDPGRDSTSPGDTAEAAPELGLQRAGQWEPSDREQSLLPHNMPFRGILIFLSWKNPDLPPTAKKNSVGGPAPGRELSPQGTVFSREPGAANRWDFARPSQSETSLCLVVKDGPANISFKSSICFSVSV